MSVISRGTGRKDYGENIETSTIPVASSHQYRTVGSTVYDLTGFGSLTIGPGDPDANLGIYSTMPTNANSILYRSTLSFNANVLIQAIYVKIDINSGAIISTHQGKYGYGKVTFDFPKGFFSSKEDLAKGIYPCMLFRPGGYILRITESFISDIIA